MEKQQEHWLDYDHLFDDVRESRDLTAKPIPLPVRITDVEHIKVYESSADSKWSSWARAWQTPEGALRVQFKYIEGGPADLAPEYRWQFTDLANHKDLGLIRTFRTVESRDGGHTWSTIGVSDDSDTSAVRIFPGFYLDRDTFLGTGGVVFTWDDEKNTYRWTGRTMSARSTDGGETWKETFAVNDPREYLMFHEGRVKRLGDGTIVLPVYGTPPARLGSNSWDAFLYFSRDGGRRWSEPLLLGRGTSALSFEEPEVAELGNGDLLVVMRHSNPEKIGTQEVYVNCGQVVVRRARDQWVAGPHTVTHMGFRGHPALLRTREGIVICAGSGNQFNFSVDDGRTWSETLRPADPQYNRHNHYPVLLELPDGRVMSFYHMGNDWPYPPPEPEWIHATSFRVSRL
jgi:hypothetical protein